MIKKLLPNILKKKVKIVLHAGNNFECPICNYKSKDFYPIGLDVPVLIDKAVTGAGLRNAGCYKCNSHDRERLVYLYLKNNIEIFKQKRDFKILHLAPEKNLSKILFDFRFENYICGDLFTEGYSYPSYVQNMNVLAIPYPNNHFDLIICNHLLEHVPNDIDAMTELYRVLKPGGKAILQVPFSTNSNKTYEDFSISTPQERSVAFGQFDHVRIYGSDYFERLHSVGFETKRINISNQYKNYGLSQNEEIFIGKKSLQSEKLPNN